jgi:YD repeat-containing protein
VYTYTPAGRLKTRAWVRTVAGGARLLTTYKYGFEGTDATRRHGDLLEVYYNDDTPGSTNSYDRRGRLASVVRTNRTVSWTYNDADRPLTETTGGHLAGGR